MSILTKSAVLGISLALGTAIAAQAQQPDQAGSSASAIRLAQMEAPLLNYDPYTSGITACPEGTPTSASKKCKELIPRSRLGS